MPVSPTPDPALVWDLMTSHMKSSAVRAAVELKLFDALGDGNATVSELASACGSTERGTRILCDFLSIMGLLDKRDGEYFHSPTSAAFLDEKSPTCIARTVHFLNHPTLLEPYAHLAAIVRSGKTSLPGQGTVEPDNPVWVSFAHSMAPMMAPMAAPLGQAVLNGSRGPLRVLDVAAGHGLFGIEVAKQNPEARIVAQDWAAVLEVARENAQKAGVSARYELKAGDAFTVDFEGPYDAILLTNFLHHFDKPTCTTLLKKCRANLGPGGRVAALEFVPNPDRVTPPGPASFALIMLATTASGDAYTFPEYQKMFSEAGFSDVTLQDVPFSPHRIVLARNAA